MRAPLRKWIGRIDPDGRYSLYRERLVNVAATRKTPKPPKDIWALLAVVPDMLCPNLIRERDVVKYGSRLPILPLLVDVYNALSGNRAVGDSAGSQTLGLSTSLSHRKRADRGSRGITPHGKRTVRNGATLLEKRYGKDQLAFATLTFPDLHPDDWGRVMDYWSKGLNRFLLRLSEFLKRKGLPGDYVGCVEIQERRRLRDGSPALHVHLTFQTRKKGKSWLLAPKKLRQLWKNAWTKVLKYGYDWSATENLQRVVKSVVNYLAKYLSKGCKDVSPQGLEVMPVNVPAWYACSNRLRRTIKMNTHKSYAIGEWLSESVRDDKDMFRWMDLRTVESQNGEHFVVCYFGQIKQWHPDFMFPDGM